MYTAQQITEDTMIVTTEAAAYKLSAKVWEGLEPLLDGQDVDALLSVVASVKASDVKTFDPEKAERARERAAKAEAIEEFETMMSDHAWSDKVANLAFTVAALRSEVTDLESVPVIIDTEDLEETTGYALPGQFSYRSVVRGGNRFWVIEIAPEGIPLIDKRNALEVTLAAFRVAASDEVGDMVPAILGADLKVNVFDANGEGEVVFDWKVRVKRGSSGPRKGKGTYEYQGQTYASLTALGEAVDQNGTKYPHKKGSALVDSGAATFTPAAEDES